MLNVISDEQEKQNKLIIQELVKKHFSYEPSSLEKFKTLLWKRDIAPEYEFVAKENNMRLIKEVEVSNENDNSFNIFNIFFGHLGVSFSDYRDNRVSDGKNKVKIQKWLFNKLSTDCEGFFKFFAKFKTSDIYDRSFCRIVIGDKLYLETGEHKNPLTNIDFENIIKINYSKDTTEKVCFKFRKKETDNIVINLLCDKEKFYDYINLDVLREAIKKIYEKIGVERAPTRKLYLIVSLNFADWFLASTSENWGSCLNLNSGYCECYWKGLPALIEDKNRCMVYLTDGTLKDYHGIKTYKIISRTWGLLLKNKKNNEIGIQMVRSYPNHFNFGRLFDDNITEIKSISEFYDNVDNYECPYLLDGMFIEIDEHSSYAASIYCDTCGLDYDKEKQKFFWNLHERGPSCFFKINGKITKNCESYYVDYSSGLWGLIEDNEEITNYWV